MAASLKYVMIAGAALMVLGITVFGFSEMKVNDYEDADIVVSRALDGNARQAYQSWRLAETTGMIMSGIGAVVIATAFMISKTEFDT